MNKYTVLAAPTSALKEGVYAIRYRVFYEDYPQIKVEQAEPFRISVVNPCGIAEENTITAPELQD